MMIKNKQTKIKEWLILKKIFTIVFLFFRKRAILSLKKILDQITETCVQ